MRWTRWVGDSRRRWTLLVTVALVVIAIAVGSVIASSGTSTYAAFGVSDPGWLVRFGTPLLRFVSYASAGLCLGGLAFAVFFTTPQASGIVSPAAYAALRPAAAAGGVWAATALLLVFFDSADKTGLPLRQVLNPSALLVLIDGLEPTRAWLAVSVGASVVAIGCGRGLRARTMVALLGLAVLATLPPVAAGHASSGIAHDLTTGAALIHVPAALLWLGTLVAVARARALGATASQVWARYRRLSLVCAVVVFGSGLVQAAVFTAGPPGRAGWYVVGIAVKVALFAAVLAVLLAARRRIGATTQVRLVAAEIVVLIVSVGTSAVLAHLPPPSAWWRLTPHQLLVGYDFTAAPSLLRVAVDWRFDVLLGTSSLLLAGAYTLGWRRLRRAGQAWPVHRLVGWLAGCGLWLVVSSSGFGRYSLGMFSFQITRHMIVGMVVPILFALGAPLTLAARALRPAPPQGPAGPAEWVQALSGSAAVRALTHPLLATGLFAATPFVMYFTPLLDLSVRYHWVHLPTEVVALVVGYLFAWVIAGADPLPAPVPHLVRLGALLAAMPACAALAAGVINSGRILGDSTASANFYTALELAWVSPLADQRLGGLLALIASEAALWALLALLLLSWRRSEGTGMPDYDQLVASFARGSRAPSRRSETPETPESPPAAVGSTQP